MKNSSWTVELETGLLALDHDNKALVALIDRVINASEEGNLGGLKSALLDLQTEIKVRFAQEEQLMAEFEYESAALHRAEHQQLSTEIQSQIDDLDADKANVAFIGRFMRNWLLQHMLSKDPLFGKAILTKSGTTDRRDAANEEVDVLDEMRLDNLKPISWTAKLSLGIVEIDEGHRAMFALFNAILAARRSRDKTGLAALLEELGNVTAAHFQSEEKLMSKINYEHIAEHRSEHQKILDEFGSQVDDWRESRISSDLLCRFMHRWLLHHIATSDVSLGEAINLQNTRFAQR